MKLHHSPLSHENRFTAYGENFVEVNRVRHTNNLIVLSDALLENWAPGFDSLSEAHFDLLLEQKPQVVLLGTGKKQRFPHPALYRRLLDAQIGVEIMDTASACRTYNILMEEGRKVACALLIGE